MRDSRRVPGHAARPMDVAGTERQRKDNIRRYEVKGDDLGNEPNSRKPKSKP